MKIEITKEQFDAFNEKIAAYGAIVFFWFIMLCIGVTLVHIFESKPPYNPRVDEVYIDTVYANDSAYVIHKQIDSAYKGEDPNPSTPDDGN